MATLLLFPNQLISKLPTTEIGIEQVVLVEHPIFYNNKTKHRPEAKLNQLRCVYTRATQDLWIQTKEKEWGLKKNINIIWSRFSKTSEIFFKKSLESFISSNSRIYMFDPIDSDLEQEVKDWVSKQDNGSTLEVLDSPLFIFKRDQLQEYCDSKKNELKKVLNHTSFYSWSRKTTGVLMTPSGKTEGGKLSWDTSNRQPITNKQMKQVVSSWTRGRSGGSRVKQAIENARIWVEKNFDDHHRPQKFFSKNVQSRLSWFAFTEKQAISLLDYFISEKLDKFGTFQDAIGPNTEPNSLFLYHSNLSHCLNNGLLSPNVVVQKVSKWYASSSRSSDTLAQTEGFLRQVIGWREFGRLAAWKYREHFWNANGLRASRSLSPKWYTGETSIKPIDETIKKAFDTGYLHHIERLMIMGNFMTLAEIKPQEMYKWFMEFSMDSYDWVMILNVFGMAAHADLGESFTKPYISSSNYVRKMGHYPKDKSQDGWENVWDALYYRFLDRHEKQFRGNPRMAFMMRGLDLRKKKREEWKSLMKTAQSFL